MEIPKQLLDEAKKEGEPLEATFRDYLNNPDPSGPEKLKIIGITPKLKANRKLIAALESSPYSTAAKILIKKSGAEKITDLFIETKLQLEKTLPEERKKFYPVLDAKDFSAHEAMIRRTEIFADQMEKNGLNGINKIFDEIEKSLELGKVDFVTEMLSKVNDFFDRNAIFSGQPYQRFQQIKKDFLNSDSRYEIKRKVLDLKEAKSILMDYDAKYQIFNRGEK